MDLVFATNNPNKFREVQLLLPKNVRLLSLKDINCTEEIEETEATLEGNALLKANYIAKRYGHPCFADDTGLLVKALNGAPGVYSARYAGMQKNAEDNMTKLLAELHGANDRSAKFVTVIAANLEEQVHVFAGEVAGVITKEKHGSGGFGYDPIFLPLGFDKTFAELPIEVKNRISHRAKALQKFVDFLENHLQS